MVKAREAMPVGGGVARALRRLGVGVGWRPSAGRPRARLRDSQASMLVSPRTAAMAPRVPPVACSQTRSPKRAGTPVASAKAWAMLMKNSKQRAKRSPMRRVEMKTPWPPRGSWTLLMADGAGVELGGIGVGDEGWLGNAGLSTALRFGRDDRVRVGAGFGFAEGEGDEEVSVVFEGGGDGGGDGFDHAIEVRGGDAGFAEAGELEAVGGTTDVGGSGDFGGTHQTCLQSFRHPAILNGDGRECVMAESPYNDVARARREGELFGIPMGELGFFQTVLMSGAAGFAAFFAATFLAIAVMLVMVMSGHHPDFGVAYRRVGFPVGVTVLVVATLYLGGLWGKRKMRKGRQ